MRIAWFTPFAAGGAVGEHSAAVAEVLARTGEVEIWTEDAGPLVATTLRVLRGGGPDSLAGADAVFYNFADGVTVAPPGGPPGIVILHRPLAAAAAQPPPTLGLVTHFACDVAALARARLEPVVALEPALVEAYAAALLEFLALAQRSAPALRLLDRVGVELGRMRTAPAHGVYEAIASDFGRFLVL